MCVCVRARMCVCVYVCECICMHMICIHMHVHEQEITCWPGGEGASLESRRPDFNSCFQCGSFSRSSHTSDSKTGNPVATLPGA